jgi:predicted P-loop ATPase
MNTLVEYALAYAELGFYVFPCHAPMKREGWNCSCEAWKREKLSPDFDCSNPGKHPRTQNGLDDATTDPEQIKRWWRQWPNANIGINCGQSGILVVDLDKYKDGYQGDDLELNEETVTCLSGGGGAHLYYRMLNDDTFGNRNKKLPAGIDIRGHGGYVIVPPSGHESGGEYRWELEYSPWDTEIAPVPDKLRSLLTVSNQQPLREFAFDTTKKFDHNATRYGAAAVRNQCALVASAVNGTRNNTLNEAAFSLGRLVAGGEVDDEYARTELMAAALVAGLDEDEAVNTVESGVSAGMGQPQSATRVAESNRGSQSVVDEQRVNYVAQLLSMAIDAGQEIDDLKPAVRRLTDAERATPAITAVLSQAIPNEKQRAKWLDSCGHAGQSKAEQWIAALRGMEHEFALNQLEDNVEVDGRRLDDLTRSRIYLEMEKHGAAKTYVDDAVNVLASEHTYHPVRKYLESLEWDGKNHLAAFLQHIRSETAVTYTDSSQAPLAWLLIRRWLLGCVARGLHGDDARAFKHQTPMLVIVGKQGLGKSSLVRWLVSGIGYEYHRESPINPHGVEDQRSMVTKWIWEVSELGSSLRRSDRDALKGFITQEWHTYRKPWGRAQITKPALCNLVGSINPESGFLDDPTGHRRFLPITLTGIDHGYSSAVDVNQLWAQIVALYRGGESPELSNVERAALAETLPEHEVENPLQTYMQMYFDVVPGDESLKCHTGAIIQRLQAFGVSMKNDPATAGRDINDALAPMGLERKKISVDGVKGWGWVGIAPNSRHPTPW